MASGTTDWVRVTRQAPCPVCERPDWCGMSADGTAACCMRIQSDKPAKNGGWIHRLVDRPQTPPPPPLRRTPPPQPTIDFDAMWKRWYANTPCDAIDIEAERLGVSCAAWAEIGAVWTDDTEVWAIPMHSTPGRLCGIRLRSIDGRKWAVKGSHAGVFLPCHPTYSDDHVVVVEGPTDAAACFDLGFIPIGRPSCLGCEDTLIEAAKALGATKLTVVADNDGPGVAGARHLCQTLTGSGLRWRLVTAGGHKDMREWRKAGATRELVDLQWGQAQWR
jgi:hypothetical protein